MSAVRQQNIEAWVQSLGNARIPIPRASHERVCAILNDSRSSLRDIAECMQDSPALVLNVIREANLQASGTLVEPAESLEIALNRLGLKRIGELLERVPALEPESIPAPLRQLQLISQHATAQASGFFGARLARLWQEVHWGSLLFLAPLWPLAMTEPKLFEEWDLRVLHKGENPARVERELFGVRVFDLCEALAEYWRLPAWVRQGYRTLTQERRWLAKAMLIARDQDDPLGQQHQLDANPELYRWLNQPANTVLLANGLALACEQGWGTAHVLRWQQLLALYTQAPLDQVQQQTHTLAVQSAHAHAGPQLWHPAVALLWPANERRLHAGLLPAPGPTPEALALWRQHCTALRAEPSPFNNVMHLAGVAIQALQACGMQRIALLMVDKAQANLRVQQLAGLPKAAAELSMVLAHAPLLQRLVERPGQLRLTPENNASLSRLIPASLRVMFRGEHLLLRSIAGQDRVLMLLLADQGGLPMAEMSVQAFGKTAQCIERALAVFSNRSR
ncbi:HDOD domain-containing protein [Pseudomonas sp. RIT-PI-S]|uniref:HDOD domain-containing protein n=1 Tax=Pseudomonas sp. RIT-PI-S TaxID=3035295 RepID=UPI0021D9624A|nr:HDOD domain-containing protein [Pseudomonas sp. RIT-PI-S]